MSTTAKAGVLILDDKAQEAMPVMQALQLLGMAAIFYDGGGDLPVASPVTHVNLVFVDMVLADHGADSNDPAQCATIAVEALGRVFAAEGDPAAIICWTKHPEHKEAFEAEFRRVFTMRNECPVHLCRKPVSADFFADSTLADLRRTIFAGLSHHGPLALVQAWKCNVWSATTETGMRLSALISKARETDLAQLEWKEYAFRICASLALAERGKRLEKEPEHVSLKALFDALNPLLADRLDHVNAPNEPGLEPLNKILKTAVLNESARVSDNDSLLSSDLRAALNTMVHLSLNVMPSEVCPGDIFIADTKNSDLADGIFPNWRDVEDDTFGNRQFPLGRIPIVMEFSASCDFAQARIRLPIFVAGFLVTKAEYEGNAAYKKSIGPLQIIDDSMQMNGVFKLVFNAHYVFGIDQKISKKLTPWRRLRSPKLAEVIAWLTNHISRPGPLHIGP